jgi:hypothetical protein
MATETIFLDGTFSGTGWIGNGTDIDEGITAADGNEISSDADGENDSITLDFANVVTIVDADTVTRIDFTIRARVTTDGGDELFNGTDLIFSSTPAGASQSTGLLTASHANHTLNDTLWNVDRSVSALNSMQAILVPAQAGMPTANTWHIDTGEAVITFTPAAAGLGIPIAMYHHIHHNLPS